MLLQYYYKNIVRQDLMTKFNYTNFFQIPAIQKITLSFRVSQSSLKHLLPLISGLNLLSFQKPSLLTSDRTNLVLKLKKGVPVGCRVTLRGREKFVFMERLVFFLFSQLKDPSLRVFRVGDKNVFFRLENLFFFKEIEKEYENFQELPKLDVSLLVAAEKREEIFCLLSSLKFPIKKTN